MEVTVTFLSASEKGTYIDFLLSSGGKSRKIRIHKDDLLSSRMGFAEVEQIMPILIRNAIKDSGATTKAQRLAAVEGKVFYL